MLLDMFKSFGHIFQSFGHIFKYALTGNRFALAWFNYVHTSYTCSTWHMYGGLLGPSYCRTIVLSYYRTVVLSYYRNVVLSYYRTVAHCRLSYYRYYRTVVLSALTSHHTYYITAYNMHTYYSKDIALVLIIHFHIVMLCVAMLIYCSQEEQTILSGFKQLCNVVLW